jgi:hypothetical protein
MRRRHFRGIKVELECGHVEIVATSSYRLTEKQLYWTKSDALKGVVCHSCGSLQHPTKYIGTCRLDEARTSERKREGSINGDVPRLAMLGGEKTPMKVQSLPLA